MPPIAALTEKEEPVDHDLPCTATLIRGVTYTYRGNRFVKNVERPVSRELAIDLRDNHNISSRDSRSGEDIERPRFRITGLDDDEDEDDAVPAKSNRPLKRAKKPSRSTR